MASGRWTVVLGVVFVLIFVLAGILAVLDSNLGAALGLWTIAVAVPAVLWGKIDDHRRP